MAFPFPFPYPGFSVYAQISVHHTYNVVQFVHRFSLDRILLFTPPLGLNQWIFRAHSGRNNYNALCRLVFFGASSGGLL